MLGSDLQTLASVADLAKTDLDPKSARVRISTTYIMGAVAAQYIGIGMTGCVWVQRDMGVPGEIEVDVEALKFNGIAELYGAKDEVTMRMPGAAGLRISGVKSKQQSLLGTFPTEGFVEIGDDLKECVVVDADELSKEINLAAEFTAKSLIPPILNCIRMQATKGEVRIMAFNGFSLVYAGRVKGEDRESESLFCIPAKESAQCLKLLKSGAVAILSNNENQVIFRGENSWVRLPLGIAADWPDIMGALNRKFERQLVTIPSDIIQNLVKAVKVLDADPYIQISGKDEVITLRSGGGESGRYATQIEGVLNGSFWYAAENIALAAKISNDVTLEIAPGTNPTLVRGGSRRVWLNPQNR